MQRAVKGVGRAVAHCAERRVAVTEIVSAAENHHNIRVSVHFGHAGYKISVPFFDCCGFLPCYACAAYAVILAYRAVFALYQHCEHPVG